MGILNRYAKLVNRDFHDTDHHLLCNGHRSTYDVEWLWG